MPSRVVRYGAAPDQFLELSLPDRPGPLPLAVVLHGGFWRSPYTVELARPLATDLVAAGYAVAAVEYRRGAGASWPQTLVDVATALDLLPGLPEASRCDLADVTVIGHSAGGQLAAWAAARHLLPDGAPGARPRLRPAAAVLQAGVLDLDRAVERGIGRDAVQEFLGRRADVPERYALADPVRLLPTGVAVLCIHGPGDDVVPLEQSERYRAVALAAGDAVELVLAPGGHMDLIDPAGPAWRAARRWLDGRRGGITLER